MSKELEKYGALCGLIDLIGNQSDNLTDILCSFFGKDEPDPPMDYEKLAPIYKKIHDGYKELLDIIATEGNNIFESLNHDLYQKDVPSK